MAHRHCPRFSRIVPARLADLEQIMEIERLSFASPWSKQVFLDEFSRDFAFLKVVRVESGERVVAFTNYWVVHDEIHVLNVACHPDWRRMGLGRKLMMHILRIAQHRRASLVTLEVRRSNHAAIQLYTSLGFSAVGIRPRYYENNEDAIVMVRNLRGPG
jgi:[ribosomal protein S18]-alanine N-acetyltransferase